MTDVKAKIEEILSQINSQYDYDLKATPFPEPKSRKESADQRAFNLCELIVNEINPHNVKLARLMYSFMVANEESTFQELSNPDYDDPMRVLLSSEVDVGLKTGRNYAGINNRINPSLAIKIIKELNELHELHPKFNVTRLRKLACEGLNISRCTLLRYTNHNPIKK